MNILAFFIGILISILVILHFKKTRLESSKFAYSLLLITYPFYYFAFAVYANNYAVIPLEFLAGLIFFIIAVVSLKFSGFYKFSFLAFGYILHGIYDISHNIFFINAGTPIWWPEFCGIIDIILGLYLLTLALRLRVRIV